MCGWEKKKICTISKTYQNNQHIFVVVIETNMMIRALIFLGLVGVITANFRVKESMVMRNTFVSKAPADPAAPHEVIFAIKQRNIDVLEAELLKRATPGNKEYQQWMTFWEVGDLVGNPEGAEAVIAWLKEHNIDISNVTPRQEYVTATAPVGTWEKLFNTKFYNFFDESIHSDIKEHVIRATEYSLPEEIDHHLHAVFNTVQALPDVPKKQRFSKDGQQRTDVVPNMDRVKRALSAAEEKVQRENPGLERTAANNLVTVAFLDQYYAIPSNIGSQNINQSVFETGGQYLDQGDLASFQKAYNLTKQAAVNVNGKHNTNRCTFNTCGESSLDIQYIMGVAQVTSSYWWWIKGTDPFVSFVTAVANSPYPPKANSMSYGSIEQQQSASVLSSFNTEAMKLGAIGVTLTVSSGDNGVANYGIGGCAAGVTPSSSACACYANSGSSVSSWTGTNTWTGTGYFPSFPATNPYVTAIGATMGTGGYPPNVGSPEQVCQSQGGGVITSGGGFSTYYPQPSWQTTQVSNYFSKAATAGTTPASGYNSKGRGYPDLAFLGVYYQVYIEGSLQSVFGTSCSSPVAAALVSLINAARLAKGLGSVGYLNPTLYSANTATPTLFNDVTSGYNNCGEYNGTAYPCCTAGYTATAGWDPTTGLGSLQYANFASIFGA